MINNFDFKNVLPYREGAQLDASNLKTLFKKLHFHWEYHENKSTQVCINLCHQFLLRLYVIGFCIQFREVSTNGIPNRGHLLKFILLLFSFFVFLAIISIVL